MQEINSNDSSNKQVVRVAREGVYQRHFTVCFFVYLRIMSRAAQRTSLESCTVFANRTRANVSVMKRGKKEKR